MKILHTADWHLGLKVPTLEISRLEEQAAILEKIKKIIEEEKIDVVLIAGDVFETPLPSIESEKVFFQFISDVAGDLGKYILLISGNHDSSDKIRNLNIFSKVFNNRIKAITDITDINQDREKQINENTKNVVTLDGITFIGIPFIPRYVYSGVYKDIFEKILSVMLQKATDTTIIFSHDTIQGATYSETEVKYDDKFLDLQSVTKIPNFKKVVYWALGHMHKQQKISNNIYYSGSIVQTNFGERDQEKGVIICEIENDGSLPNIQIKHLEQKVELLQYDIYKEDDVDRIIEEHSKLNKESYVKILIKRQINASSIEKLKSRIKNSIIVRETVTSNNLNFDIKEIKSIIDDPIEMFKKYCKDIKKQSLSTEEIEYLKRIYHEVLSQTNQG